MMKKVLFSATVDLHILKFHLPYLKMFKDKGYEVHVATNGDESIPYCDVKHKICFERNPFKLNNLKAIRQLKKVVDSENFEIVHCHTPMGSVVTRIAAMKARENGTRVIYTAHGFHFFKGAPKLNWLLFYPIEKWLSRYTDTLITINREDYDLAKKKFRTKQIELVHGVGVTPEKFTCEITENEKDELREEIGISKEDFVMISVGELNDNKNQIMQIQAMKEIVKENSNIKLLIAGEGDNRKLLEKKIGEYNLEDKVKLLGYRKDISKLLKLSNLALSTSKREGLPVNVIEALMSGIPVIGTNCRGTRDLIQDGINGYIVNIDNSVELCKSVMKVFNNNLKFSDFGKEYIIDNVLSEVREIYNKKQKILFHAISMRKGGAERVIANLSNSFTTNYDVTIINTVKDEIAYALDKRIKVKSIDKKVKKPNRISKILSRLSILKIIRLKNIILSESPDVIIAFLPEPSFRILLLKVVCKKINNIPIIVSVRNDPAIEYKSKVHNFIMRKLYPKADGFVFQTEDAKEYFTNIIDCTSSIIANPVGENFVQERYTGIRENRLVAVGRLEPQKNQKILIEAFEEIHKKHPDYLLEIYGRGTLENELKTLVNSKNLNSFVIFKGNSDKVEKDIYKAKAFIMTSDYEGMPNALLEAFVLGVPCVSTDCPCGGPRYIIKNNEDGILVPVNDVNAIVDAVNSIIENKDIEEKLSINANFKKDKFTIDNIAKEWNKIILEVKERK